MPEEEKVSDYRKNSDREDLKLTRIALAKARAAIEEIYEQQMAHDVFCALETSDDTPCSCGLREHFDKILAEIGEGG